MNLLFTNYCNEDRTELEDKALDFQSTLVPTSPIIVSSFASYSSGFYPNCIVKLLNCLCTNVHLSTVTKWSPTCVNEHQCLTCGLTNSYTNSNPWIKIKSKTLLTVLIVLRPTNVPVIGSFVLQQDHWICVCYLILIHTEFPRHARWPWDGKVWRQN